MKNSTATVTILSIIALSLFAASGLVIYRIAKNHEQIKVLISGVNDIQSKELLAGSIRNIQNTAKDDLSALQDESIPDGKIVNVIEKIESTGRAMHLDITTKSIDKEGEATGNAPQKIRIVLGTSGSWSATYLFLLALENLPYRFSFESVNLNKGETAWDADITFALYNFK